MKGISGISAGKTAMKICFSNNIERDYDKVAKTKCQCKFGCRHALLHVVMEDDGHCQGKRDGEGRGRVIFNPVASSFMQRTGET